MVGSGLPMAFPPVGGLRLARRRLKRSTDSTKTSDARSKSRFGANSKGQKVRAHLTGRVTRRIGTARPPPHLYWLDVGKNHSEHPQSRSQQSGPDARRGRQARTRLSRRPGRRAAGNPRSRKDLRELPDNVRAEMKFIFVEMVEDALSAAIPGLAERMKALMAA